jgi:hypothetical protein
MVSRLLYQNSLSLSKSARFSTTNTIRSICKDRGINQVICDLVQDFYSDVL